MPITLSRRAFQGVVLSTAALLIGGCASLAPAPQNPPPQYNVRDFFSKPEQSTFRLSSDGKILGFMKPYETRKNIHVQPVADAGTTRNIRRLTNETARDISGYFFKGSHHILYSKDFGGDENFHVVMVDVRDGTVRDLTPHKDVQASVLDDLPNDANHILVTHNHRNKEIFDVYRVDLRDGKETMIAQNPGTYTSWVTDHAGNVRMAGASEGLDSVFYARPDGNSPFKEVLRASYKDKVEPQFFTADNQHVIATSNLGRDKSALVLMDPAKGKVLQNLYERDDVDVWGAAWSRHRKTMTRATYQTDRTRNHYFDDQEKRLYERLSKQFPGSEITIQSMSDDETMMIVAATSDVTEGARYLYNAAQDQATMLAQINPKLKAEHMSTMQPVQYQARDGVIINGYLTLPQGSSGKNLPLIVNPHGGPWARDSWGFNSEVQFLANRGYAVFQPNFRGSTGYGRKFWELSFKQWGGTMQDDVTDGVQWLISRGIADPKRIGIYGGSYGGYATLSGIVKTPDLYAAAVNYVGVSNLLTFMKTIPPYWELERASMYEMVGNPEKDLALLTANSPALNADKIKTPLFVAQGAKDPRVNKAESDQMVEALRKRGVTVDYLVKDNEGHGFQNQENQFEFYDAMERFFGKHLSKK